MFEIRAYDKSMFTELIEFYRICLPQSGRKLDLNGHHRIFCDIENNYDNFWVMLDDGKIIGTSALKKLNDNDCELKSLYLLEDYYGNRLGYKLLQTAVEKAKEYGYTYMKLDALSSAKRAYDFYKRAGFTDTTRYNDNPVADVFMVMPL